MSNLGPAYLIHGDDHGAVAERRVRLRAVAEAAGPDTAIETLEGAKAGPAAVAEAVSALHLGVGRRVIVVDGVERWKDAEVREHLLPVMTPMPPATTLALFASEDTRAKAPPSLHRAVKAAGGSVAREATLKPWELPKWVRAEGERLGVALDADGAKALIAEVGERRQRILRELEKLALELGTDGGKNGARPPSNGRLGAEEVELRVARSSQLQAYALAGALVEGALARALLSYVRLRAQGERVPGLLYVMASRLRQALGVAVRLEGGESADAVKRSLRIPSRAAERLIADARSAGQERLREALGVLADLEMHTRGGPVVRATPQSAAAGAAALDEDTLALRAIEAIAGGRR
jgi:DNA polymerase-3 subunit delta